MGEQDENGGEGSGSGFGRIVLILTGVSALSACLLTLLTTILQAKNYRKPLLQRHVIRIFILVPIFAIASWASLTSLRVAFWIEPFRDVYEAFTLYTFFQLLVNFLGGERSLIIMMHGRPPVNHLWPLNHCLAKVDISDPHMFLSVKRGILQYAYIKPVLAVATVIMKATDTFKDGVISWDSGYFWTSVIYNVSICWSLYDLALFWVCMSADLQPFRPMPKFLCIKGIIFASWWQGFFLSILVFLGAIPSIGGGYTADNLATAIQDALICFEMPFFAISHWYAFSWTDYADRTISDARMPIRFALRDAFGPKDLIEDAKETFSGKKYEYRYFDAEDNVMAHEDSSSREARMREGMRYERNGKGKYWIPAAGHEAKQPLLARFTDSRARTMSPGGGKIHSRERNPEHGYGTSHEVDESRLDEEEERLYSNARALEFGDWNYPVINTHYASREDRLHADPGMISASTNRSILQPSAANKQRRKSRIQSIQEDTHQHGRSNQRESHRPSSSSTETSSKGKGRLAALPVIGELVRHKSSSSSSANSQLVDLVVEDEQAEQIERVRARKEGGPGWNSVEQKHFVQVGQEGAEGEEVRQGFNPDRPEKKLTDESHALDSPFAVGDGDDENDENDVQVNDQEGVDETGHHQPWERREYGNKTINDADVSPFEDERHAWGS
nr:transmembrane protein 184 like [Quercus suber]POE94792.1 transmembrane protein 184 like [Quercus suber]